MRGLRPLPDGRGSESARWRSQVVLTLSLTGGLFLPLAAQTPPAIPPVVAPIPAAPAPATTPPPTPAPPAVSPVPATEPDISGWVDFGYRWRSGVSGSLETYRSIVNLGSGPKLFGADVTLIDPTKRFFDTMHVLASGWGGDPYGTFHLDVAKAKRYRFDANYRDLSYFNNLPSYADPLLTRGIILDEQSFDTRRHIGSYSLELLPGNWFVPYVAYDRDANSGAGVMSFTANSNEYAVPTTLNDLTNLYRGGVRFELRRFHATLEEGGTTFSSSQSLYQNPGVANPGNSNAPVFGQTLDLTGLAASYGITGSSTYTKALFSSNAFSWMDVYGQFLFSEPSSSVHYQESATGNLYLPSEIVFYQSEQYLVSASAKLPHTTGSLGTEIRPLKRVRLTESWLTDRMHDAGNSASLQTIVPTGGAQQTAALLASSLASDYSQTESNVYLEVTDRLTLRGGYRYVWGDASDAVLPQAGELSGIEHALLRRNVGLGGVIYRPIRKLLLTAEGEAASSTGVYFNTSLYNYQKLRTQARYQATPTLSVSLDFTYLNNQNPTQGLNYYFRSQQEAASIFWSPRNGKIFTFQGSYSFGSLRSDILYLVPASLTQATSNYVDHANTATALFTVNLGKWGVVQPKLTAGGSLFISKGSLPTAYYQPMAKLWVPLSKHVQAFAQWWYYGYGEAFAPYEGFGTHLAAIGLRYAR
jgi:hypothetical protein